MLGKKAGSLRFIVYPSCSVKGCGARRGVVVQVSTLTVNHNSFPVASLAPTPIFDDTIKLRDKTIDLKFGHIGCMSIFLIYSTHG